jgi:hypothetical protein
MKPEERTFAHDDIQSVAACPYEGVYSLLSFEFGLFALQPMDVYRIIRMGLIVSCMPFISHISPTKVPRTTYP